MILDEINGETYLISDTHFFHSNVQDFEPSRITNMRIDGFENHDEWLIDKWNSVIKEDDIVIHLGDFAFKGVNDVQHRLNGRKILILGNHDKKGKEVYSRFELVIRGLYIDQNIHIENPFKRFLGVNVEDELFSALIVKYNNKNIMINHYPYSNTEADFYKARAEKNPENRVYDIIFKRINDIITVFNQYNCEIMIHGHTHSKNYGGVNINVSVENIGFKPVKLKDII